MFVTEAPLVIFQEHSVQDWTQLLVNMVSSAYMTSSFCHAISQASVNVAFHAWVRFELVNNTELVYSMWRWKGDKTERTWVSLPFWLFFLQEEELLRFLMVTLQWFLLDWRVRAACVDNFNCNRIEVYSTHVHNKKLFRGHWKYSFLIGCQVSACNVNLLK